MDAAVCLNTAHDLIINELDLIAKCVTGIYIYLSFFFGFSKAQTNNFNQLLQR